MTNKLDLASIVEPLKKTVDSNDGYIQYSNKSLMIDYVIGPDFALGYYVNDITEDKWPNDSYHEALKRMNNHYNQIVLSTIDPTKLQQLEPAQFPCSLEWENTGNIDDDYEQGIEPYAVSKAHISENLWYEINLHNMCIKLTNGFTFEEEIATDQCFDYIQDAKAYAENDFLIRYGKKAPEPFRRAEPIRRAKQLDWEVVLIDRGDGQQEIDGLEAYTAFGTRYCINLVNDGLEAVYDEHIVIKLSQIYDLEQVRASCQDDYNGRWLKGSVSEPFWKPMNKYTPEEDGTIYDLWVSSNRMTYRIANCHYKFGRWYSDTDRPLGVEVLAFAEILPCEVQS